MGGACPPSKTFSPPIAGNFGLLLEKTWQNDKQKLIFVAILAPLLEILAPLSQDFRHNPYMDIPKSPICIYIFWNYFL